MIGKKDKPVEPNEPAVILGNFTIGGQLPNGHTLNFSGYIMNGEGREQVDARLDMFVAAIERQRQLMEIPVLEGKLKQDKQALEDLTNFLNELSSKERNRQTNSQEKQQLRQIPVNIARMKKQIAEGEAEIAKRRVDVEALKRGA